MLNSTKIKVICNKIAKTVQKIKGYSLRCNGGFEKIEKKKLNITLKARRGSSFNQQTFRHKG